MSLPGVLFTNRIKLIYKDHEKEFTKNYPALLSCLPVYREGDVCG